MSQRNVNIVRVDSLTWYVYYQPVWLLAPKNFSQPCSQQRVNKNDICRPCTRCSVDITMYYYSLSEFEK